MPYEDIAPFYYAKIPAYLQKKNAHRFFGHAERRTHLSCKLLSGHNKRIGIPTDTQAQNPKLGELAAQLFSFFIGHSRFDRFSRPINYAQMTQNELYYSIQVLLFAIRVFHDYIRKSEKDA